MIQIQDSNQFFKKCAYFDEEIKDNENYIFLEKTIEIYKSSEEWILNNPIKVANLLINKPNKIGKLLFKTLFVYVFKHSEIDQFIEKCILENKVSLKFKKCIFQMQDIDYILTLTKCNWTICINILKYPIILPNDTIHEIINMCSNKDKLFYNIIEHNKQILDDYPIIMLIIKKQFYNILLNCTNIDILEIIYPINKIVQNIQVNIQNKVNIKFIKKIAKKYNIIYTFAPFDVDINNDYDDYVNKIYELKKYVDPITEKYIILAKNKIHNIEFF